MRDRFYQLLRVRPGEPGLVFALGAILFANKESPSYDATRSLLCANCHGTQGEGGTAPFVLQPEADICLKKQNQGTADVPECLPKQVSWAAPALNSADLRFDDDQLTQIISYGRPGTPMRCPMSIRVRLGKSSQSSRSISTGSPAMASSRRCATRDTCVSTTIPVGTP